MSRPLLALLLLAAVACGAFFIGRASVAPPPPASSEEERETDEPETETASREEEPETAEPPPAPAATIRSLEELIAALPEPEIGRADGSITGRVATREGTPVADVRITLTIVPGRTRRTRRSRTRSDGSSTGTGSRRRRGVRVAPARTGPFESTGCSRMRSTARAPNGTAT